MEPIRPFMRLRGVTAREFDLAVEQTHVTVETFEVFYHRAWDPVYRAVSVTIDDHDLAREAVDEAMTRAFERWRSVSELGNREGWVYRVAVNWARSGLRKLRTARMKSHLIASDGVYQPAELDPDLHRAILGLPPHQREMIVARFLLGLTEKEMSKVFEVPTGTVKSRLSRAMEMLREELK
jgi:RNA polymerase sigma factor (sigma-70 family)